jgi:hypothetical protein
MTNRKEPRIFLCHASEDKARVRELYRQLKAAGYHPWLDEEDLLPGQRWWPAIRKVISDLDNLVLVCLTCNSVNRRGVVQQEIKRALDVLDQMPDDAIYLIPARLEDCPVPDRLAHLHRVDLFEPRGFERLRRALDFELGKRQPPLAPATRSPAPQAVKPGPAAPPPLDDWPEVARVVNQAGKSLRPRPGETLLRTGDLQRAIERLGGYAKGAIAPTDYCYNRVNKSPGSCRYPVFEWVKRGRLRYLGPNYAYSGPILWKPQAGPERQVGEWKSGACTWSDDPRQG